MAERKLNINAPLLSVRRFSMKSSSSNGDDEKGSGSSELSRRRNVVNYRSDSVLDQVTEPVAVPFQWEKIPGRRKDGDDNEPAPELGEKASVTPRLPPGRVPRNEINVHCEDSPKLKALASAESVAKLKSFGEGMDEKEVYDDENGDDSDSFSDALDTLTMAESSFSMTCSVGGLSSADVKSSGTLSTDAQARDFMMSRFLPAAKAMTLQPTQYASKKQTMASQEQSKDKMVVAVKRPPSPMKYGDGAITIPHYDKEGESEDQNQDEEHYDTSSISAAAKGCGLFTRLYLKSSLCLLNPVPGMKVRTRALTPSKFEAERPSKAALNPSARTHTQTIKRDVAYKHKSGELPRLTQKDVLYKHKSGELPKLARKDVFYKHKSGELPKLAQKVTGGSQRFSFSGNLQTMGGLSPSRRSGGISPYRREAPQSPFRGAGFLGIPKEVESFKSNQLSSVKKGGFVSHQKTKQGSCSVTPTVEKTLYVDTVSTAQKPCPNISFPDIKRLDGVKGLGGLHQTVSGSVEAADEFSFSDTSLANDGEDLKTKTSDHQNPKVEDLAIIKVDPVEESPLPPPLPKSPSESWLWRTLPSANVQNSLSKTQFLRRKQDVAKPSTLNSKWETIVKTSNPRHDHARYSQELITHPSQPYKT